MLRVTDILSFCSVNVFVGVGDGRGRPAHPLPQRHSRGWLQQRQVRKTMKEHVDLSLLILTCVP